MSEPSNSHAAQFNLRPDPDEIKAHGPVTDPPGRSALAVWQQTWPGDVLALLAGAALALAFAPFDWWPLAIFLPALLFVLWWDVTPRRAAWRGYLFGVGMFAVGASWLYVAIHVYGFTSAPVAVLLTALFVAFLGLFTGLQGYLSGYLAHGLEFAPRLREWVLPLTWPAVWVLFEWLRGWVLTGFPWLNLGYSQLDSPLSGWAPVLGNYGISWAVILTAGVLVYVVRNFDRRPWIWPTAVILVWGVGAGLHRIEWTWPVGEPISVAMVQGNVPQITKWQPGAIEERLRIYRELTRANLDAQLIIWPENSVTVFYHRLAESFFEPLRAEARERGSELLIGLPYEEPDGSRYYSSFASLGDEVRFYHKRHLVPFGEYVPLESWLRGLVGFFDVPMSNFSRGAAEQAPLVVAGQPIAVSICYEDAFGEEVIDFLPAARFLVNGSNNAWYGDSLAPHQHLQFSRMRAAETSRALLRVTTNGISAFVDHRGRVLAKSAQFQREVLRGSVQPREGATPYVRYGNWPVIVMVISIVIGVLAAKRRSR